jgi:acyl carrier protein
VWEFESPRGHQASAPITGQGRVGPFTVAFAPALDKRAGSRESPVPSQTTRRFAMASALDRIADIIAETSDVPREKITPDSHVINDLGIDSLDFLDIVFAIDKEFGIKVPLEKWTQEVNDGKASTDDYFVMKNLCAKIDALVAAKTA